jgi:hypothetical protein
VSALARMYPSATFGSVASSTLRTSAYCSRENADDDVYGGMSMEDVQDCGRAVLSVTQ